MSAEIPPRWLSRKNAVVYSGIPKTTLDIHIRNKAFKTRKVGRSHSSDFSSI